MLWRRIFFISETFYCQVKTTLHREDKKNSSKFWHQLLKFNCFCLRKVWFYILLAVSSIHDIRHDFGSCGHYKPDKILNREEEYWWQFIVTFAQENFMERKKIVLHFYCINAKCRKSQNYYSSVAFATGKGEIWLQA